MADTNPKPRRQTYSRDSVGSTGAGCGIASLSQLTGGLGVVPRSFDQETQRVVEAVQRGNIGSMFQNGAGGRGLHRLLRAMKSTHPMCRMALSNNLSLAFGAGTTRFVAIKDYQGGAGQADDSMTQALQAVLKLTYGSLERLQCAIAVDLHTDGSACVEAVPGEGNSGIDGIYDVDVFSLRYRDVNGVSDRHGRVLEQRVKLGGGEAVATSAKGVRGANYKALDPATIFTCAYLDSWRNPYGEPIFASFLTEGPEDAIHQQGIKDGLHGAFYSKTVLESTWSRFYDLAARTEESGGPERDYLLAKAWGEDGSPTEYMTPAEFADAEQKGLLEKLSTTRPDDYMLMPEGSNPKSITIDLRGIDGILDKRLIRVAQSLCHPLALLNISLAGREAWAKSQVQVYVAWLEGLRCIVNAVIAEILSLHLRLMGVDMIVRCETLPISIADVLALAEVNAAQLKNAGDEMLMGFTTPEEAAMRATGTGLADEQQARAWMTANLGKGQAPAPAK